MAKAQPAGEACFSVPRALSSMSGSSVSAAASAGSYASMGGYTRCSSLAAAMPAAVDIDVASSVGSQIPAALLEPIEARRAITPSGASATLEVLIARNSAMASVATPGHGLSRLSSIIALMPNGVAALPSPSMLLAMFMIIALIAGCSGGTSGKRRTITGRSHRASICSRPPSCTIRIMPSQNAITPIRPMASITASLADSTRRWSPPASCRESRRHHRGENQSQPDRVHHGASVVASIGLQRGTRAPGRAVESAKRRR